MSGMVFLNVGAIKDGQVVNIIPSNNFKTILRSGTGHLLCEMELDETGVYVIKRIADCSLELMNFCRHINNVLSSSYSTHPLVTHLGPIMAFSNLIEMAKASYVVANIFGGIDKEVATQRDKLIKELEKKCVNKLEPYTLADHYE